jgi:hypothetical protein
MGNVYRKHETFFPVKQCIKHHAVFHICPKYLRCLLELCILKEDNPLNSFWDTIFLNINISGIKGIFSALDHKNRNVFVPMQYAIGNASED